MKRPTRSLARRAQLGQAAAEFPIIGALFLGMLGGLIEMPYVFRAKHVLNMATFDAARTGSVNNAKLAPMEQQLENDMAALFMQGTLNPGAVNPAIARAKQLYDSMKAGGQPLTIISQTLDIYNKFGEQEMIQQAGQNNEALVKVIPNDNLQWRARTTKAITADGKSAAINVQDANLLKIRVYWCQHLVVPGLDYVVHSIVDINPTNQQRMCDTVGEDQDNYYIALKSDAVVQMQNAGVYDGTNLK